MSDMSTLLSCVLICVICPSGNPSDNGTKINRLLSSDPFHLISHFLSHEDQRTVRLACRPFNYYFDKTHSDIIKNIKKIAYYATEFIVNGTVKNESIHKLKEIYQAVKFREYYLRKWPVIIAHALEQNTDESNEKWMYNFVVFMSTLNVKSCSALSLKGVPGLLVMESHKVFDSLFFDKPKHLDFHLFLYETMWIYLSISNSSFRLPPLESIFYLDDNSELYEKEISNLHTLHDEYGLIVWDPNMLSPTWSSDLFEHVNEYKLFCKSCKRFIVTGFDSEFLSYLQVRFILRLLEDQVYDLSLFMDAGDHLFDYLEFIIRDSVHYLWTRRYWNALDQVLLALHDNKALQTLQDDDFMRRLCDDSNAPETFIGILIELYVFECNYTLEYGVCNGLSKSLYLWFVEDERDESMMQIAKLFNHCLVPLKVWKVLVAFLEEPMFYFTTNQSKAEYLTTIEYAPAIY